MLTFDDKIFVVHQYAKCRSYSRIRRMFRNRSAVFHGKNLPSISSLQHTVHKFQQFGTVLDRRVSSQVQKLRPLDPQVFETVKKLYTENREFA